MAYVPKDKDTESEFRVSKTTSRNVISSLLFWGKMYYMFGTTTTTVVEFRGLTRDDALDMGGSAEYNYDNRHDVGYRSSAEWPYAWMRANMCEGATCRADAKRSNEADMWRVTVTYTDTVVTHSGGWIKDLL